ncbi:hypothetical protein ACKWTF_014527 [Chironomus riparius]
MREIKLIFLIINLLHLISCTSSINLECEFNTKWSYHVVGGVYRCDVKSNLNITSTEELIVDTVTGQHMTGGYTNGHVYALDIRNKIMNYFLQGVEKLFTALQVIQVNECQLKHLSQTDLKPFAGLTVLDLEGNDLGILEEGIFDFNTALQWISLSRNKILHVDSNVFDKLASLTFLSFMSNKCQSSNPAYDSASVKELIVKIKAGCLNSEYLSLNSTLKGLQKDFKTLKLDNFKSFSDRLYSLENNFTGSKFSYFQSFNDRLARLKNDKKFTQLENFNSIETKIKELETDDIYFRTNMIDSKMDNFDETAGSELEQEIDEFDDKLDKFNDQFTTWVSNMEYNIEIRKNTTKKPKANSDWDKKFQLFEKRLGKKIDKSFKNLEKKLIKMINDI